MGRPVTKTVPVVSVEEVGEPNWKEMYLSLNAKIDLLMQNSKNVVPEIEDDKEIEIYDIPLNKAVKVVSLYKGGLTLFTQRNAQGKPYRFNNFGVVRTILYGDLIDCISHQNRFFTEGFVMILDKNVNKAQGFEECVAKFLTKDQIEKILTFDNPIIEKLLSNTTKSIIETVVDKVISKLISGESVDMNKVKIISDAYGRDLNEIVKVLDDSKQP